MAYTPDDMLEYVFSKEFDKEFLLSMSRHTGNYSIGEIIDKEFKEKDGEYRFISKGYGIDVPINDDEIITAAINGLYTSAFISRKEDKYNVHFLVHRYPVSMKPKFEEEIMNEVIRYMILRTIIALRLDTKEKIRKYCNQPINS